jgi:hypothetical protein
VSSFKWVNCHPANYRIGKEPLTFWLGLTSPKIWSHLQRGGPSFYLHLSTIKMARLVYKEVREVEDLKWTSFSYSSHSTPSMYRYHLSGG